MSEELRRAFEAFMEAVDKELTEKDNHIRAIEDHARYLESQNSILKANLKKTAAIFADAAYALQEGLDDY